MIMKKNKILHLVLGGVVATGLVVSSFAILAQPNPKPYPPAKANADVKPARDFFWIKALRKLDLSSAQRDKIGHILDANKEAAQRLHQQMGTGFMQLKDLVLSDKDHQRDIDKIARTQGDLMTRSILDNVKVVKEVVQVLTPSQVDQLRHMKMADLKPQKPARF
jgi:Spy/CpxP family protein refolding chaperone